MQCGLLGQHLPHSFSPMIHALLGDPTYVLFEKEPQELADFLRNGDFVGLNVTIPYKKAVLPYLDAWTDTARAVGAVNTVVRRADGSLLGHNSDFFGFRTMVERSGLSVGGKKCLVLGSGGAGAAAVAVLRELGAQVVVISRRGENNYENLHLHADAAVIVNATPVGMFPHWDETPLSLDRFPALEGVLDLIYNPAQTRLLQDAQDRHLICANGLWMLVAQAAESHFYFTGDAVAAPRLDEVYRQVRAQTENIVLIGMPGCGKTTVGKALAAVLGRPFLDTDEQVETIAKRSVPAIFAEQGEAAFRALETRVLKTCAAPKGAVIATGGGCITREENHPLLRQNGRIVQLQRDVAKLSAENRPLSVDLNALQRQRSPLYAALAQIVVDNNGTVEQTVHSILEALQ